MSILSGYKKVKNYIETGSGKKLLSRWTSSNTVECDDGKTVQTKVGAIKGITTSTSATETGYAADATTVAALNQSLGNIKHFYMGTKVVQINSGNNSYGFLSTTEIKNLLGVSSIDVTKLSVVVMNGDAAAFPSHFESVSYGNNTAYIVFKDKLTQDMKCRINYVIFYNG